MTFSQEQLFSQLLSGVGHLKQLRALTVSGFRSNDFIRILDAAPQLQELQLMNCQNLDFGVDECSALDILKGQLEVKYAL